MSSKLDKSAIVGGAGLVASIFTMLVKKVQELGGTDEDIHRLSTPQGDGILDKIAEVIVGGARQVFRVLVDYTKTLKEMIAAGHYDWTNSDITADHFPVKGEGRKEVELVLFHFGKVMTSEQVISEMDRAGYRPATIEELLALGASQPELLKSFPVVALGSVWQHSSGIRRVACLPWRGAGRHLHLVWLEGSWSESCRFAGARK